MRIAAVPWRFRIGRGRAFLWRFQTLALAHRLFDPLAGPYLVKRSFCGFDLHLDVSRSNAQRLLYLEGERFVGERTLLRRLLRPGMRVTDVGANLGYYLLLAESLIGPGGTIACIEPEPDNVTELRRNVEANALQNAQVFPVAAGDVNGTVSLRSGINSGVAADGSGDLRVPMRRLDDLLTSPLDFLKVDVEGYEGQVLAGARRLLERDRPTLFVEVHPGFLAAPFSVDAILGLMREHCARLELFEISPQVRILDKLMARYLGRAIRPVPDPEALLADCRTGRREEPFWAVGIP